MKQRDLFDLLLLAALWGASFLFSRIAAPAFGALALAETRVVVAALVLLPLLVWRSGAAGVRELRGNAGRMLVLGAFNTAIPFALFAWAVLTITAGLAAILNATAPMFAALIAWVWLRERLTALQGLGMAIGFAGVLWLAAARAGLDVEGARGAVLASLAATLSYGLSGNLAKHWFSHLRPLTLAAGSQTAASLLLLPFALYAWPDMPPSPHDWAAALALGVLCTGLAYLLYFRLLIRIGAARAMTVTFLIPGFGMLWGALFLGEAITATMLLGCAVILAGTALSSGTVRPRTAR